MKILIIGGGNMGLTYAQSFINSRVVNQDQLMILERPDSPRLEELNSLNLGQIVTDPNYVKQVDLIILAVKPQDVNVLFDAIRPYMQDEQLVVSIMAGVKLKTIQEGLGVKKVVRAMPNLPSQIRHGMTGFTSTDEVSRIELGIIQNLLSQTGKTLQVDEEDEINVVTAISGSGPAYVYYFMDSMMKAAIEMGMNEAEAELLVLETFLGSVTLFQQQSLNCNDWITKVSSKGGTTEAAIKSFEKNAVKNEIVEGLYAALERARELGS